MGRSFIHVVNPTAQEVYAEGQEVSPAVIENEVVVSAAVISDGVIDIGNVGQNAGLNLTVSNNAVNVVDPGHYRVDAVVVAAPTEPGEVTVSLYMDDVPVEGAVAAGQISSEDNVVTLPVYENDVLVEGTVASGQLEELNSIVTLPIHTIIRKYDGVLPATSKLKLVLSNTKSVVSNVSLSVEML